MISRHEIQSIGCILEEDSASGVYQPNWLYYSGFVPTAYHDFKILQDFPNFRSVSYIQSNDHIDQFATRGALNC